MLEWTNGLGVFKFVKKDIYKNLDSLMFYLALTINTSQNFKQKAYSHKTLNVVYIQANHNSLNFYSFIELSQITHNILFLEGFLKLIKQNMIK